eukprot:CAMPEP_0174364708 /NCGR_PEP_ID=MMETSP0811_2-20130205/74049_1 /TAXON_ID=73025 ORGANISM="Eutreptiella gymnastica-like, Strain CCMP1594" /NCGR_SAMPLE_ID=MMETSP0811_2 /ASSEMBLY_ACC=CAM_ASM_000667 /LENGTH=113 /DNA_ID=CAMNT_0015504617 /DNA_START=49 /DNA_END=387 /DNA_ORIENTATION=-
MSADVACESACTPLIAAPNLPYDALVVDEIDFPRAPTNLRNTVIKSLATGALATAGLFLASSVTSTPNWDSLWVSGALGTSAAPATSLMPQAAAYRGGRITGEELTGGPAMAD